jgi:hypothetical protein
MYMRVHRSGNEKVVAVCDSDVIGKRFQEGMLVLDLERYRSFYEGDISSPSFIMEEMKNATSMNMVGERSVGIAIKLGVIKKGDVRRICNVPHVQIYKVEKRKK